MCFYTFFFETLTSKLIEVLLSWSQLEERLMKVWVVMISSTNECLFWTAVEQCVQNCCDFPRLVKHQKCPQNHWRVCLSAAQQTDLDMYFHHYCVEGNNLWIFLNKLLFCSLKFYLTILGLLTPYLAPIIFFCNDSQTHFYFSQFVEQTVFIF